MKKLTSIKLANVTSTKVINSDVKNVRHEMYCYIFLDSTKVKIVRKNITTLFTTHFNHTIIFFKLTD